MCFGNEAFYGVMYIGAFWTGPSILGIHLIYIIAATLFPVAFLKSIISGVHLITASQTVAGYDQEKMKQK
jgi:CDP-diacylglycerol--inositol 3-phosphatidyltransferase